MICLSTCFLMNLVLISSWFFHQILAGGEVDVDNRYVAPTIVTNVKLESKLMEHEIFGE